MGHPPYYPDTKPKSVRRERSIGKNQSVTSTKGQDRVYKWGATTSPYELAFGVKLSP